MREYRQYKGMYIGPGCFNSKEEIDRFLERQAVYAYEIACEIFMKDKDYEAAAYADEKAERLVNQFGYNWEQIEEIESEIYKKMAEIA